MSSNVQFKPNHANCKNPAQGCRKRLQNKFEECDKDPENDSTRSADRSVLSVLSFSTLNRRALRNGAERISKTFNNVRTSLGTFSQKFKISTKRRQILEEGPATPNCATPYTFSKQVLGRTPTKLYSPFGIETPHNSAGWDKENVAPR